MSTPWIPLVSENNDGERRTMALNSSWIRRLCPNSHDDFIPVNLKPRLPPRSPMPNNPLLPPPPPRTAKEEVVEPSNLAMSFGPFRVRPDIGPLRPSAHDYGDGLVDVSGPSQFPRHCTAELVGRRIGSSSRGGVGGFSSASGSFYNPHAFDLNSARRLRERKNYGCAREPEEPFSYWNMGMLEKRANFVSSVYPSTSLIMPPARKRTMNTYGFISSKFRRFHSED